MVENTFDYSYDQKVILQKCHLKLLKKLTADLFNQKQIFQNINLLNQTIIKFIYDIYLVADFSVTTDVFKLADLCGQFKVVDIFIYFSLSYVVTDLLKSSVSFEVVRVLRQICLSVVDINFYDRYVYPI